jgi:hypothetical protein
MPPLGALLCDPTTAVTLETFAAGSAFAVLIPTIAHSWVSRFAPKTRPRALSAPFC